MRAQLGKWMAARLDEHALFRRLSPDEMAADVAAGMLTSATEEGMKVARNEGQVRRCCSRQPAISVPHPIMVLF